MIKGLRKLTLSVVVLAVISLLLQFFLTHPRDIRARATQNANEKTSLREETIRKEDAPNPLLIIIVSHYRTGSTFVASLFQQHPDSFYVFEPIRNIYNAAKLDADITYLNRTRRHLNFSSYSNEYVRQTVKHWIECQFESIDIGSHVDISFTHLSRSVRNYAACLKKTMYHTDDVRRCVVPKLSQEFSRDSTICRQYQERTRLAIQRCLSKINEPCEKATIKVFKFIRLQMKMLYYLLREYKNLKIIHLVRDPRGMFISQLHTENLSYRNEQIAYIKNSTTCQRIFQDISDTRALSKAFAGRIKLLRYEDMAYDPIKQCQVLYNFTNIPFTEEIKSYIWNTALSGGKDSGVYDVKRGNSTYTAYRWREQASNNIVQTIDSKCENIYEELGYIKVPEEKLRDAHAPLFNEDWIFS